MIERSLFSSDHEAFRDSFRKFVEKEICLLYTSPSPRD